MITRLYNATIDALPEMVRPFSEAEIQVVEDNGALLPQFFREFVRHPLAIRGPDDLDAAFASWAAAADHKDYEDEAVVQLLRAAFVRYCARTLDMTWVIITDQTESAAALSGVTKNYRAFPFHAIRKRIRDRGEGFFKAIYIALDEVAAKDWAAVDP